MTTPLIETLRREALVKFQTQIRVGYVNQTELENVVTTTARRVLEAVREGVPTEKPLIHDINWAEGYNACRNKTLTHLDTLQASTKTE